MTVEISASEPCPEAGAGVDRSPAEQAKRKQILDGARATFLARGFEAASMGEIARAAGVSKGTLYVYFDSKDALFTALLEEMHSEAAERAQPLETRDAPPAEVLRTFALGLARKLVQPGHVAMLRVVIGASERFPDIARSFYRAGPVHGAQRLSIYLAAETVEGRLDVPDPDTAAGQFLGLCSHPIVFASLAGMPPPDLEAHADATVRTFLAAFGPGR